MRREIIYPKDLHILTGRSLKSCRSLLEKMKTHYRKEKHQVISAEECSKYLGIDIQVVLKVLL